MVVFLALFIFLDRKRAHGKTPLGNALVIGMLAASACGLRTNLIPPCVLIIAFSCLWYLKKTGLTKEAIAEVLMIPLFTFLMVLPWLLSLLRTSGTLLYPVLGTGFDEVNYGFYLPEHFAGGYSLLQKLEIIFRFSYIAGNGFYWAFLISGVIVFFLVPLKHRASPHAFALGTLLAGVAILLRGDISNPGPFHRYLFIPFLVSLIVFQACLIDQVYHHYLLADKRRTTGLLDAVLAGNRRVVTVLLIVCGCFAVLVNLSYGKGNAPALYAAHLAQLVRMNHFSGELFPEADRMRYARAQVTVPADEGILADDYETFLYDFRRNRIYTMSDPGTCSPPPGMPYFQGAEAVAAYLLAHQVRYVAYAYASQAGYPVADNLYRFFPENPYLQRITVRAKVALDRVFGELGGTRARVYDDGRLFILDLKNPAAIPTAYREPNYFQLSKVLSPIWASTRGFDDNKVWTDGHGVIEGIHYQPDDRDDLLLLNTFGYHPWRGDWERLKLIVSVNGVPLQPVGDTEISYMFALNGSRQPITSITIDSSTFLPRTERIGFGRDDDLKHGIDVDTILITNRNEFIGRYPGEVVAK